MATLREHIPLRGASQRSEAGCWRGALLGRAMLALPAQQIWHLLKARAEPARLKFNERKISRKPQFREGTMSRKTTTTKN